MGKLSDLCFISRGFYCYTESKPGNPHEFWGEKPWFPVKMNLKLIQCDRKFCGCLR
jgi:hypothetical protein